MSEATSPTSPKTELMVGRESWRGVYFEGTRATRTLSTLFKSKAIHASSTLSGHPSKGMRVDEEDAKRRTMDSISSLVNAESTGLKIDLLSTRESRVLLRPQSCILNPAISEFTAFGSAAFDFTEVRSETSRDAGPRQERRLQAQVRTSAPDTSNLFQQT